MAWLFGQVWILCVISFAAGSAVTWLLFVRPLRDAAADAGGEWTPVPAWTPPPAVTEPEPAARRLEPPAGRAVDPALATLDGPGPGRGPADPGVTATGALDLLGVAGAAGVAPIDIPRQAVPVDSPDPGGQADGRRR